MALTPTVPPTKKVAGPQVDKTITTYQISSIQIMLDVNDSSKVLVAVKWVGGYVENNKLVAVETKEARFQGDALADKINANTTGQASLYAEVKKAVWELLQADSYVPAGTIS